MFILIITVHVLFWIYVLFGSFLGAKHAAIILFWIVPITWMVHILPFHIFGQFEERELGVSNLGKEEKSIAINKAISDIFPLLKPWYEVQEWGDRTCYANPSGGQGMLIIGSMLATRVLTQELLS